MTDTYCGDLNTFNMDHGYNEALVRGYKSGFLTDSEYHHIAQCENIEDVKLNLQETDYGNFLGEESSPIFPSTIRRCALKKLAAEWAFMRAQAVQPLAQFMDFTSYEFMIDNIILILKLSLSSPSISKDELVAECNPLGMLPDHIIKSIAAFENSPQGFRDLFQIVLVELPVGKYFCRYLDEQTENLLNGAKVVKTLLEETSLSMMEQCVKNYWLEEFYYWTQEQGGYTADMMGEILKTKADTMAINVILNSFNTIYNDVKLRGVRQSLLPSIGFLYPEGIEPLNACEDVEALGRALEPYWVYRRVYATAIQGEQMTVDDAFYLNEVRLLENGFDSQFHLACYYGYVHLKLQEIRNLVWICECIVQKQRSKIEKYIPIFSPNAAWRHGKLGI